MFDSLLFPGVRYDRAQTLDPDHPAHAMSRAQFRSFPKFDCPAFTVRALPDALMTKRVSGPMAVEDKLLRLVTMRRREGLLRRDRDRRMGKEARERRKARGEDAYCGECARA